MQPDCTLSQALWSLVWMVTDFKQVVRAMAWTLVKLRVTANDRDAFIFSHLVFCNSLFTGLNKSLLHCLQTIQNTAASVLTQSNSWSYITLIFTSIHWLSVHFRIYFNILVLTYRTPHGQAPQYICDLPHPHTMSRALRSSSRVSWVFLGHISRFGELVQLLIFGIVSQLVWELWMLWTRSRKVVNTFLFRRVVDFA